ncbi:MAG: FG-GAP repeat domain-containing protein [Limnochordia bacterium]
MRKRSLFVVFSILLLSQAALASAYIAVEVPEFQNAVVLAADLYGEDEPALLLGQGHILSLFKDGAFSQLIDGISGRITAVAAGDINGDFKNELVVATDSGGALYFFAERNGLWERFGQTQYLWDSITHLEVHDFDNDGWGDLLALTTKGEAHVFLSSEGTLFPFWKSEPGEIVAGIEALDVDHDGSPEVIYALQSGYIGVLTLEGQEFATLWENYPWGLVESLVVVPHQTAPEWLVVTNRKMLYGWRYRNGEVISTRLFEGTELGETLYYFPGQGLLSLSAKTGVSLFELQSSSVSEQWRVPGLFGAHAFYYRGTPYLQDAKGTWFRIEQGSSDWRVFLYDQEVTELVDLFSQNGEFYYRLPDVAKLLGLQEAPAGDWHYLADAHEIVLEPEGNLVKYDGLVIPLNTPILVKEGLPYVSSEVFPLFGWTVEPDVARQHLTFRQNWGWWL